MAMSDADRAKAAVNKLIAKRDKLQKELTEVNEVLASLGIGQPVQTVSEVPREATVPQPQKKGGTMADVDPMLDTIPTTIKEPITDEEWNEKQREILRNDDDISADGELAPADNMGPGRFV